MEGKEEMAKNPLKKKVRKILRKQIEVEKKKEKVKKKALWDGLEEEKKGEGGRAEWKE